jgi:branched-chain amino acid transport system ATP-binding protein
MNNKDTLEVKNLSAQYGLVPAIDNISLSVKKGSVTTLIGANGAGKSTVIKAICGLVKPSAGTVELFGETVTGLSPDQMVTRGLAVVPEGRRLFGSMTVLENLELGAYARNDETEIKEDLTRILDLFPDLKDRLAEPAKSFSGGQQQMIAVARALMSAPRILLLDEPTVGLSPVFVDRIAKIIRDISSRGVDILLVEQNVQVALSISDYGYVLENGRVSLNDTAENLVKDEGVQAAYLGG